MSDLIQPFHTIAGCSLGTKSGAEIAFECLDFIETIENSPAYNDVYPPMAKYWRELALDCLTDQSDFDLEYYADLVSDHCDQILPVSCAFTWHDGEFGVLPYVDECEETYNFDSLDSLNEWGNPDNVDFCYLVNDHGNVTCCEWIADFTYHWHIVWEMV